MRGRAQKLITKRLHQEHQRSVRLDIGSMVVVDVVGKSGSFRLVGEVTGAGSQTGLQIDINGSEPKSEILSIGITGGSIEEGIEIVMESQ